MKTTAEKTMREELESAIETLKEITSKVGGNDGLPDRETASFYRGYNAVLRSDQSIAQNAICKIRAAISKAEKTL